MILAQKIEVVRVIVPEELERLFKEVVNLILVPEAYARDRCCERDRLCPTQTTANELKRDIWSGQPTEGVFWA